MSKNVFRLSEAQHDAYKARRAKQCAVNDGMASALIGGIAVPVLEFHEPIPQAQTVDPTPCIAGVGRANKFGNVKTDGYDSRKERNRAFELRLMQEAGQIRNLREQVPFLLIPTQRNAAGVLLEKSASITLDFVYEEWPTWRLVAEDTKSDPTKTTAYVLRRKLLLFVHGIHIKET